MMVKNIGKFLFRVKCKWEGKVKKVEYKGNMYSLVGYCKIVYK
jgi:hypothetical protein